jgi:hypothetical protein
MGPKTNFQLLIWEETKNKWIKSSKTLLNKGLVVLIYLSKGKKNLKIQKIAEWISTHLKAYRQTNKNRGKDKFLMFKPNEVSRTILT